jgi:hypothetical protein
MDLLETLGEEEGRVSAARGLRALACLAGYDRTAGDEKFIRRLPLIEQGALEERNLVN